MKYLKLFESGIDRIGYSKLDDLVSDLNLGLSDGISIRYSVKEDVIRCTLGLSRYRTYSEEGGYFTLTSDLVYDLYHFIYFIDKEYHAYNILCLSRRKEGVFLPSPPSLFNSEINNDLDVILDSIIGKEIEILEISFRENL